MRKVTEEHFLETMLSHVPFDGWSRQSLQASRAELGLSETQVRLMFPQGALDAAIAFHRLYDRKLAEKMVSEQKKFSGITAKITGALRMRLELVEPHKEAVRRSASIFILPTHAAMGSRLIWETADTIWLAVGDRSTDHNWYTKRMTLSGVYSSVVLYWLEDQSPDHTDTWAFLDRRIADVMRIEKMKAAVRKAPLNKALFYGPRKLLSEITAPKSHQIELPGRKK